MSLCLSGHTLTIYLSRILFLDKVVVECIDLLFVMSPSDSLTIWGNCC